MKVWKILKYNGFDGIYRTYFDGTTGSTKYFHHKGHEGFISYKFHGFSQI